MMTSHDDKASNDDYEAVLVTENNKYYFHIKELQIIASGDTIESAHSELLRKKSDLIKDFEEAGSIFKLPLPSSDKTEKQTAIKARETGFFAIKALTAGFILVLVISFAGNKLNQQATSKAQILKQFLRESPAKIARGLEQELYNAGSSELSAERKEKIRENLRILVKQIQPFVEELWPLLPKYRKITPEAEGTE